MRPPRAWPHAGLRLDCIVSIHDEANRGFQLGEGGRNGLRSVPGSRRVRKEWESSRVLERGS